MMFFMASLNPSVQDPNEDHILHLAFMSLLPPFIWSISIAFLCLLLNTDIKKKHIVPLKILNLSHLEFLSQLYYTFLI